MANKRISNKIRKEAPVKYITIQQAWDVVAEYLAKEHPMYASCYFIDEINHGGKLNIHTYSDEPILISSKTYECMKKEGRA